MTRNELDTVFTNKVKEYFSNDFTICTKSMSGSQGEIARVDLSNGSDLIRIFMESKGTDNGDTIIIVTGKDPQKSSTIWNSRLEVIEKSVFLKVSKDNYIPIEEAENVSL